MEHANQGQTLLPLRKKQYVRKTVTRMGVSSLVKTAGETTWLILCGREEESHDQPMKRRWTTSCPRRKAEKANAPTFVYCAPIATNPERSLGNAEARGSLLGD